MSHPAMRGRLPRLTIGIMAAACLGAGLTACGDSGTSLARQACVHVDKSLVLLKQSDHQPDASRSEALRQRAYIQLRTALPIAAQAALRNAEWQALATTLSESNRVAEAALVSALGDQCKAANASLFNQPPAPSSIPPPAATSAP